MAHHESWLVSGQQGLALQTLYLGYIISPRRVRNEARLLYIALEAFKMSDQILIDLKAGIADVRLNRPEKMNAVNHALMKDLVETTEQLAGDPSVRAVVLSGEGRSFCSGLDMAVMATLPNANPSKDKKQAPKKKEGGANLGQLAAWSWHNLPVPVIAAVHGVAYGAGIQLALAADMRVVAPDARLSFMEIKWGLVPDMSGPQALRELVRTDIARELFFTGRVVSGEEAAEIGLATRVSDTPYETAMEMAFEIASKSPDAIRAGKRLLNGVSLGSIEEGLALEEQLQNSLIGTPNQGEAVAAAMQKRAPDFEDAS